MSKVLLCLVEGVAGIGCPRRRLGFVFEGETRDSESFLSDRMEECCDTDTGVSGMTAFEFGRLSEPEPESIVGRTDRFWARCFIRGGERRPIDFTVL